MTPSRRAWLLASVALVSLLSHLKGISSPPLDYHYHRQTNTAAIARNYQRHGLDFLNPRIDWQGPYQGRCATEFPLYMWLTGLFWPILGWGALWGRLLSALFSALTAIYLFLFLEKRTSQEAAFYSSVLFSFIPLEIYFGRTIQPEALALLGTTASLYHWDNWLAAPRRRGHWGLAVLFAFLAISHKLPYAYVLLPLAALAWLRLGKKALRDVRVGLAALLAAAGVLGWYRYAGTGTFVVPTRADEFWRVLDYKGLLFYIQFQFLSRFPELAATYGGLILWLIGARELIFKRRDLFLPIWLAAVSISLVIGGGYAFFHEYTSLPLAPVNAAFMGYGLFLLKEKVEKRRVKKRPWAWAALALLVASIPVHSALRIKHWYKINYPFLAQAAQAAASVSAPEDLFICNQRAASTFLFFLDRKGWSWDLAEAGEKSLDQVEEKIKAGAKFFMTEKSDSFKNKDGVFARYFYSSHKAVYDRDGMLIFKLRPQTIVSKTPG